MQLFCSWVEFFVADVNFALCLFVFVVVICNSAEMNAPLLNSNKKKECKKE
jgi:hypothetical protein